jgi:hypothetical protein
VEEELKTNRQTVYLDGLRFSLRDEKSPSDTDASTIGGKDSAVGDTGDEPGRELGDRSQRANEVKGPVVIGEGLL